MTLYSDGGGKGRRSPVMVMTRKGSREVKEVVQLRWGERKKIIRVMVVTRKGSREAIKALYNDGGGKGRSPE